MELRRVRRTGVVSVSPWLPAPIQGEPEPGISLAPPRRCDGFHRGRGVEYQEKNDGFGAILRMEY